MTKTKMTLSDMYNQPYYRSIITLLRFFDETYETCGGLTQTQIRYALQEDLEMTNITKQKMKRYYGKKLEKLFKISDDNESIGLPREIYRDCIKKGSHLSYYLNKLVEYNVIEKKENNKGNPCYRLKNIKYEFRDIKPILSQIKHISKYAFVPTTTDLFQLDEDDRYIGYDPLFVGFSPEIFGINNKKDAKEFEQKMLKLEEAIIDFLTFARKFKTHKETFIIIKECYIPDELIESVNYAISMARKNGEIPL